MSLVPEPPSYICSSVVMNDLTCQLEIQMDKELLETLLPSIIVLGVIIVDVAIHSGPMATDQYEMCSGHCVGRGGALVQSMPIDQRVAGYNPALVATYGPWASPSLRLACSALTCKLRHSVNCCGRERF